LKREDTTSDGTENAPGTFAGRRDFTSGPIASAVWALSLPMVAGNVARTTFSLVDAAFVGALGAPALAAVTTSGRVMMLLSAVFMGVATASTAMVARAIGARDGIRANHVAAQSMFITFMLAAMIGAAGYVFSADILRLLGADDEVVRLGAGYMKISFAGIFFMLSLFIGAGILRGAGDAVTPLVVSVAAAALNIALDPLMIFGLWGFPRLGVNGAALASVTSQAAAFAVGVSLLSGGRLRVHVRARDLVPSGRTIWTIFSIGLPNSVQMSVRFLMMLVLTRIVAPFGTVVLAAFGVGERLHALGFMPTFAIAEASAALVGQNLGAGKPDRAKQSAMVAAGFAAAVMGGAALAAFVFAPRLMWLFTRQGDVIAAGTTYIRITAAGHTFAAVSIIMSRSISGAGDTIPPMLFTLFTLWLVQIPLAYILSAYTPLRESGIWWAGVVASAMLATMGASYFLSGRWRHKKL